MNSDIALEFELECEWGCECECECACACKCECECEMYIGCIEMHLIELARVEFNGAVQNGAACNLIPLNFFGIRGSQWKAIDGNGDLQKSLEIHVFASESMDIHVLHVLTESDLFWAASFVDSV